jgi:hypothetical protein
MPRNGEINKVFGVYQCAFCEAEITIREGARFPDCKNHQQFPTIWMLIERGDSGFPEKQSA